MNLAKLREDVVMKEADWVSLYFKGKSYTNFEMMRSARKFTAALKKLGVKKGDRVIVQMPNCPEVMQTFMSVWRLGAIIVPINYMMGEEEVSYIYKDSGAKIVVSGREYLPKIRAGQACCPRRSNRHSGGRRRSGGLSFLSSAGRAKFRGNRNCGDGQ